MKLQRFDVLAFGALRATSLSLASGEPCLHVVYGPNEAGKSTALRALHGLFYGISEGTPDAHRYKANELRIAALLQDARGRELYVVRRKGRKQTLAAADGRPLAGADVSWITAGMPEAQFASMFALSYDTLEQGADELLGSRGELGQSLFSAGTGGTGAHAVLEALRQEADALYRPRGRTQILNGALTTFEEAKRSVREHCVLADSFAKQQRAIEEAEVEAVRLSRERQTLMTTRVSLERARRVLPLLAKRTELRRQRDELGSVATLPDSAADDRRVLERARRDASLRLEHVAGELAALEEARAAVHVNEVWLDPATQLQLADLRDRLLQYRRSQRRLPALVHGLSRAQADQSAMLERLGLQASVFELDSLRVSKPIEAKIREHARRGEAVHGRCADLERQLAAKRDEVARHRGALVARRFDPESAARQIELPLSPERLSLSLAQVEEFESAAADLERERKECAKTLRDEEKSLERTLRDLEALANAGQPPTEQQLAAARDERRGVSERLREALQNGAAAPEPAEPSTAPDIALARRLLRSLDARSDAADVLADRLRREATRVAEYARLRAAHAGSERQLERLRAVYAGLEERARDAAQRWAGLCARAGIAARTPAQMRAFLSEHREQAVRLEQLERDASRLASELEVEHAERATWRAGWSELVVKVGSSADASVAEVEALLAGLADVFAKVEATKSDAREIETLSAECTAFERDLAALGARLLPELQQSVWDAVADALLTRDQLERRAAERRAQLDTQLAARAVERERAEHELAATERELAVLMQAAGVSDLAALEAAEEAARRGRELDRALAQAHAELLAAADGLEPMHLEADLAGASVPEVVAKLQDVEDTLEQIARDREAAIQTVEGRRAGLKVLYESRGAADAALDAGAELENVRLLALRYVRVRLAHSVLSREVERYRERHTGPILRAASSLFQRLTAGAFSCLEADFGDADEPILVCVRANGDRVGVPALSAGTRDQLYLALRLASIEQLSASRELMPLVLDDVLVHFDDERARAALSALGEFASVTQVLLFTHHNRVCELAREALSETRLRIHRLPSAYAPALDLSASPPEH